MLSERNAITVTVVSPVTYYEIEFFADGHIESQTCGPASDVREVSLDENTRIVLAGLGD